MHWIRNHAVTLLVLGAIVLSFAVGKIEADQNAQQTRLDNVASCARANDNAALISALVRISVSTSRAQERAQHNPEVERLIERYASFAAGGAHYLAIASYIKNPERATRVRRIPLANGDSVTVLTRPAERLILEGCARTFHAEDDPVEALPAVGPQG